MKDDWNFNETTLKILLIPALCIFLAVILFYGFVFHEPKPPESTVAVMDVPLAELIFKENDQPDLLLEDVRYACIGQAAGNAVMTDTLRGYSKNEGKYSYCYSFNGLDPSEFLVLLSEPAHDRFPSEQTEVTVYQSVNVNETPGSLKKAIKGWQEKKEKGAEDVTNNE